MPVGAGEQPDPPYGQMMVCGQIVVYILDKV